MGSRYPALASPSARTDFLILNVAFSALVLAVAPFFVTFIGLPTPAEAAIFALALVPLVAAVTAARAGRLLIAHCMSAASFAGIGLVLAFWTGAGSLAAYPWLALAGLEAAASLDRGANALAVGFLTCAVAAVAWAQSRGLPDESGATIMGAIAVLVSLVKGPALARRVAAIRAGSARLAARNIAISKASGDVIVGFGRAGLVEWVSDNSSSAFGACPADFAGRGLFEHVHVADRPRFLQIISNAAHGSTTEIGRIRLRCGTSTPDSNGRTEPRHLWIEMRAHPSSSKDGQPPAVIAVLRELAPRSDNIIADPPAPQAGNRQPISSDTDLLSHVDHDLRTPLNAIIGFSEILSHQALQPADEGTRREYARTIHQSGKILLSTIDLMLEAKKIRTIDQLPSAERRGDTTSGRDQPTEQRMKRFA